MNKRLAAAAVAVCLLVVAIFGVKQALVRRWKWEAIVMPERLARVPTEWPVETLARRLQETRKVRDAATFREAARQVGLKNVVAGAYRLPEKAGPLELARIFKAPPPLRKVTFPEGWTALQMGERLKANGFAAADDFLRRAYPADAPVSPWEGRLFPNTYLLPTAGTGSEIADRLMDRFREVAAKLPKSLPLGDDDKPLTLDQVVILASLVERETDVEEERPLVAGVLLNRLRRGMRLQCDATIQYARQLAAQSAGAHKNRLLYRDLAIESPFNTYRVKGLPPGPICNPGEPSLRAAAAPRASEYLYYVMSPRLKRHRFAATYAGHQRNVRLYRQESGY